MTYKMIRNFNFTRDINKYNNNINNIIFLQIIILSYD